MFFLFFLWISKCKLPDFPTQNFLYLFRCTYTMPMWCLYRVLHLFWRNGTSLPATSERYSWCWWQLLNQRFVKQIFLLLDENSLGEILLSIRLLTLTAWGRLADDHHICFLCLICCHSGWDQKKPFMPYQTILEFRTFLWGNGKFWGVWSNFHHPNIWHWTNRNGGFPNANFHTRYDNESTCNSAFVDDPRIQFWNFL